MFHCTATILSYVSFPLKQGRQYDDTSVRTIRMIRRSLSDLMGQSVSV